MQKDQKIIGSQKKCPDAFWLKEIRSEIFENFEKLSDAIRSGNFSKNKNSKKYKNKIT